MKRRDFLAAFAGLAATPALAQAMSFTDTLVEQLKQQGFNTISVARTWLGRVRIVASNARFRREIVLNPRTGEILRDVWVNLQSGQFGSGFYNPDDEDDNYSRSGGSDDDEDDEDDEDDDEDDDDESNRSGSNSGKG